VSEQAAPWAKNPEPGATTPKGTNTLISPGAADTGAEPMVTIDNVSKIFGKGKKEVAAVKNVSLTVKKGEIFAIIGYPGAGKSTLGGRVTPHDDVLVCQKPPHSPVYRAGRHVELLGQ